MAEDFDRNESFLPKSIQKENSELLADKLGDDADGKDAQRETAREALQDQERQALSGNLGRTDGNLNKYEQDEKAAPTRALYKTVKGGKSSVQSKIKQMKKTPLFFVIVVFLALAGFMFGGVMTFPLTLAARIKNEYNSITHSNMVRSKILFPKQMKTGLAKTLKESGLNAENYKLPSKGIFGVKFGITKGQAKRLASQGIEYDGKAKSFLFTDNLTGQKHLIDADNFDDFFANNSNFRNGYLRASKTWRGHVAGWFDKMSLKVMDRIGFDLRGKFKHFKASDDVEAGNRQLAEMGKLKAEDVPTSNVKRETETEEEVRDEEGNVVKDENGKPKTKTKREVVDEGEIDMSKKATTVDDVKAKLGKMNIVGSGVCAAVNAATALNIIIAAKQTLEIINLTGGLLESIDKVKVGKGNESPLNNYMHMMTMPDENGETAMQAFGIAALFGMGGKTAPASFNQYGTISNNSSEGVFAALKIGGQGGMEGCAYFKVGMSVANAVLDVMTLGAGSILLGVVKGVALSVALGAAMSGVMKLLEHVLTRSLVGEKTYLGRDGGDAIGAGANKYLSENGKSGGQAPASEKKIVAYQREVVAKNQEEWRQLARDTLSPFDISSEYTFLGSIFYAAIPVMAQLPMGGRLSMVSFAAISALPKMTSQALANILPSANALAETKLIQNKGQCPALESVGLMGDAYCNPYYITDETTIREDPAEIYEKVWSLGKAKQKKRFDNPINETGDQDCLSRGEHGRKVGYYYTYSLNFKWEETAKAGSCKLDVKIDDSGNPAVNLASRLGAYITFCGQRSSQLGLADAGIGSQAKNINFETGEFNEVLQAAATNPVLGAVPVVGGLLDAMDALKEISIAEWASGFLCGASEKNTAWETEMKYYQRYMEDQRWMEGAGLVEQSSIDKAVEEHLAMMPLDKSYTGTLARFSGLPKADVVAVLDYAQYMSELAQYQPSKLGPTKHVLEMGENMVVEGVNETDERIEDYAGRYVVVYADLRRREILA